MITTMNVMRAFYFIVIFTSSIEAMFYLYEVTAYNTFERKLLYALHISHHDIIFPGGVSNEAAIFMNVLVKYDTRTFFENHLKKFGIHYHFMSKFKINMTKTESHNQNPLQLFHNWGQVQNWFIRLKSINNVVLETNTIAKTYDKRNVVLIKLSNDNKKKPILFIVGGEDGIDWMSSAVLINLTNRILQRNNNVIALLDLFNLYLVPVLNPDGFAFSHNENVFWFKNRKKIISKIKCPTSNEKIPVGVNLARNWFMSIGKKSTGEECNAVYTGSKSLSEFETQGLSYVLNSLALDLIAFINLKGFGHFITIPYGYTRAHSNNHDIVMDIIRASTSKVMSEYNSSIFLGTTSELFYNFYGGMADWVKTKLNTPFVLTISLCHGDSIFPQSKHIELLSYQFFTMLNETLPITKEIYGPLFNSQTSLAEKTHFIYFILYFYL